MAKKTPKIKVAKNGPYIVSGNVSMKKQIIIADKKGVSTRWQEGDKFPKKEKFKLCRCGLSKNKPYCDKTHIKSGFDGTETAVEEEYFKRAEITNGPDIVLVDVPPLCALARFCDRDDGVWNLAENSGDSEKRKIAIEEACDCPAGRLVVKDKKTGKDIEPKFKPSIGLVEDPEAGVSGPVWVRGGIPIESADGKQYKVRNRVTLCRCGKSKNKPFCDGSHIASHFSDEE